MPDELRWSRGNNNVKPVPGAKEAGTAGLEGGVYRQMPAYVFLSLSSFPRGVFETPNCLRTLKLSLKEIIPNCEY